MGGFSAAGSIATTQTLFNEGVEDIDTQIILFAGARVIEKLISLQNSSKRIYIWSFRIWNQSIQLI